MIAANELRVGNLVYWKDDKLFHEIRSVSKDQIHPIELIERDYERNVNYAHSCKLEDLNPAPLTPRILMSAGFKYLHRVFLKNFDDPIDLTICFDKDGHAYFCGENIHVHNVNLNIQYVHQLQNLHFAITGEELKLNNL